MTTPPFNSQTQEEQFVNPMDPAGQGSEWSADWLPNWNPALPRVGEAYNDYLANKSAMVEAYQKFVREGFREDVAIEKVKAQFSTQPQIEPDQEDEDEEEEESATPTTMHPLVKLAFWILAVGAVAWFVVSNLPGGSPLAEAVKEREAAARAAYEANIDFAKATEDRNFAELKRRTMERVANAAIDRYEKAYKREACLVNGTCK